MTSTESDDRSPLAHVRDADDPRTAGPDAAVPDAPAPRRQPGGLVEVFVENGTDEPDLFAVRVVNADRIAWEMTLNRHKEWPEKGRSFAMTFLTWSAAKREGRTAVTFEQWQKILLDWDEVPAPSDPTRQTAPPTSTAS